MSERTRKKKRDVKRLLGLYLFYQSLHFPRPTLSSPRLSLRFPYPSSYPPGSLSSKPPCCHFVIASFRPGIFSRNFSARSVCCLSFHFLALILHFCSLLYLPS